MAPPGDLPGGGWRALPAPGLAKAAPACSGWRPCTRGSGAGAVAGFPVPEDPGPIVCATRAGARRLVRPLFCVRGP